MSAVQGPSVSVVIPTYNRSEFVVRAIESVLMQSYSALEVIVVDDASCDDTSVRLNESFSEAMASGWLRVHTFSENKGVSAARNYGARHSSGEWLAFLDSDDEWHPEKLARQREQVCAEPNLKWIHCNEIWLRNGELLKQKKKHEKNGGDVFASSLQLCLIGASCVMLRRDMFEEAGGFDDGFPVCEDYDLWLRLLSLEPIGFVSEALVVKHAGHADQLSFKFHSMDYWRVKSLAALLDRRHISGLQRALVAQTLCRKAHILLAGFVKHKSWPRYSEVASLLAKAEHSL